jgi:hypothetical protein
MALYERLIYRDKRRAGEASIVVASHAAVVEVVPQRAIDARR